MYDVLSIWCAVPMKQSVDKQGFTVLKGSFWTRYPTLAAIVSK